MEDGGALEEDIEISIHASAWEATMLLIYCIRKTIFQFTPLHERQPCAGGWWDSRNPFQFTPLHERQLVFLPAHRPQSYFNSRLCMRGNVSKMSHSSWYQFQFTPLHERQRGFSKLHSRDQHFNSRLCMRGNLCSRCHCIVNINFNSRLCMRGNTAICRVPWFAYLFQFTPLHERQQIAAALSSIAMLVFQFTPLHERQQAAVDRIGFAL